MISHYIILSSSYSKGCRIALHKIIEKDNGEELKKIVPTIIEKCGRDVSISTHCPQSDSKSWESIVKSDPYFEEVEVIENLDEFINLIQVDRTLKGIDVARYIISKVKCTHLKLEKLVYFCYAQYLCKYDEELFDDKIYAYKYGPVVESVYRRCKEFGYREIDDKEIDNTGVSEMANRSRIMFAKKGVAKITTIDKTIEKYGGLTAKELVELTHKENTPWDKVGRELKNSQIIPNEVIKKYHCNEEM